MERPVLRVTRVDGTWISNLSQIGVCFETEQYLRHSEGNFSAYDKIVVNMTYDKIVVNMAHDKIVVNMDIWGGECDLT